VFFKEPFEFYFHYILFIILLPFFLFKYGVPKIVFQLFFIPLIVGVVHLGLNNNEPFSFMKIFGGLVVSILFFYYIIVHLNFNVFKIFKIYIKFSFLIALIGVVQLISYYIGFVPGYDYSWVFNKWGVTEGGLLGIRLNSLLSEPAQLAIVLSPAVYLAIRNLIHRDNFLINKYQSILVLIVSILSTSSVGLIGIVLSLLFNTNSFRLRYLVFGIAISIISYNVAYKFIPDFKTRVDSAVGLWIYQDFNLNNTNNSSFVVYNNIHIATENIKKYPVFGTGLGSYEKAYSNYTLTGKVIQYDFEFNTKDGNSLLVRLFAETGILGVFFIILIIIKFYIKEEPDPQFHKNHSLICKALLMLIILTLIRQGNYMLNGLPLIFLLYYYNSIDYKNTLENI